MTSSSLENTRYVRKKNELEASWRDEAGQLRLAKSTISNLFRYKDRGQAGRAVSLGAFNEVIALDAERRTLDVEGLATFETIVDHCLPQGFLPLVAPELKHITVGGATVGIGIESTCFRHGFVHDALLEADVLLPGGRIITCSADNEHSDLFHALPNSYGTLGYILRAKITLAEALPYVHVRVSRFDDPRSYLDAMRAATDAADIDFVEGLFFEDRRFYLMLGRFSREAPQVDDIVRKNIFYKLVQARGDIFLRTPDYIFRYDPEWFWNIPESPFHTIFRRYAPRQFRNSSFYTKYSARKKQFVEAIVGPRDTGIEPLIQDWEVPWQNAEALIDFCLENVSLNGLPWAALPIRTPRQPDALPDRGGRAIFQSRLLLSGPQARGQGTLSLHEDHGSGVFRARRDQDAVLIDVPR